MIINQKSSHNAIKAWQNFLNKQGFNAGHPDGFWGPKTEMASKLFQETHHLVADGIVGKNTINVAKESGFDIPSLKPFEPIGHSNTVFDISHHQGGNLDFAAAKHSGMMAVFHKATEGTQFPDQRYTGRMEAALQLGLLWGAYHFGRNGNGIAQADYFLSHTHHNDNTVLVLDLERASSDSTMSLIDAQAFVKHIKIKTGKYPILYGGAYLKSLANYNDLGELLACPLWLAQYTTTTHLPAGWPKYTFWQYTDGTHGPGAMPVTGIGKCDRDLFNGSKATLVEFWSEHKV